MFLLPCSAVSIHKVSASRFFLACSWVFAYLSLTGSHEAARPNCCIHRHAVGRRGTGIAGWRN